MHLRSRSPTFLAGLRSPGLGRFVWPGSLKVGCLTGEGPQALWPTGPSSSPALLGHASAVTLSLYHPLWSLGDHGPLSPRSPGEVRVGFKWHPGRLWRWVWGVMEQGSQSGIPGPHGPSGGHPCGHARETCWGLHSSARQGWVGAAEPMVYQPPQIPWPVWAVPGCQVLSLLLGVLTQERAVTAEQAASPVLPPVLCICEMPNSPHELEPPLSSTSLPGTSFVGSCVSR